MQRLLSVTRLSWLPVEESAGGCRAGGDIPVRPPAPAQPRDTGQLPGLLRGRRQIAVSPPAVSAGRGRSGPVTVQGPPVVVASGVPVWPLCGATRTRPWRASCLQTCGLVRTAEVFVAVALLGCGLLAKAVPVAAEAVGAGRAWTVASAPRACFERVKKGTGE